MKNCFESHDQSLVSTSESFHIRFKSIVALGFGLALSFSVYANDEVATADPNTVRYFKKTYAEADSDFEQMFQVQKKKFKQSEVFSFLYDKGNIKSYYLRSQKRNSPLILIISGVHGVEFQTGSAIQRYVLDQLIRPDDYSYLFIHGFNLWGAQNNRRVNENNVDLNRNFIVDRSKFQSDDSQYGKLDDFLNPKGTAYPGFLGKLYFFGRSLLILANNSIEVLRQAILKGQYNYPTGIFYGGVNPQDQEIMLEQLFAKYLIQHESILVIDLHTGYGERGRLHLLTGPKDQSNSKALAKIFDIENINSSDEKKFYEVKGGVVEYILTKLFMIPNKKAIGAVFEFGTLNSQKPLGSIESLRRIVIENQSFHYPQDPETKAKVDSLFLEMFYPEDPAWRNAVLEQAKIRFLQIYEKLK